MKLLSLLLGGMTVLMIFLTSCTYQEQPQPTDTPELDDLSKYCRTTFEETGKCPEDKCAIGCGGDDPSDVGGCPVGCDRKSCTAFEAENCPLESCQIMTNCKGEEVCYSQFSVGPPECGGIGSYTQDVACCEGLVKRCGIVLKDGSCDTNSGGYNNFPQCIPCGNGICDQFENKCSCPEDCK